jgi:uncharacterized OsmC-like protein
VKAIQLKECQARKKAEYQADPALARRTLTARGVLEPGTLACRVDYPVAWNPSGLHEAGGGDGSFACPVEIMLAGLAGCAGVTMCAVASSMKIEIKHGEVIAEGDMDFCGTLAVDRNAPVGLTAIRLRFELETNASQQQVQKLVDLTHRYCVVHRTLDAPPPVTVSWEIN